MVRPSALDGLKIAQDVVPRQTLCGLGRGPRHAGTEGKQLNVGHADPAVNGVRRRRSPPFSSELPALRESHKVMYVPYSPRSISSFPSSSSSTPPKCQLFTSVI